MVGNQTLATLDLEKVEFQKNRWGGIWLFEQTASTKL